VQLRDALGGCDQLSLDTEHGAHDQARLQKYLEADERRRGRC